jgi:protein-disulfide isomerase
MPLSKREEIKAHRTKKKRQQRMITLLTVVGVIIVIILFFATPTIIDMLKPVGSFVAITPVARPFENGKAIGNPNAKVVIEVYEDFQCPICEEYTTLDEAQLIASSYITDGQVYYIFRQYPFIDRNSTTKESQQSANASMCAMEQDRFWDYHAILYANQGAAENSGAFSDKRLQAFAESLNLNMTAFNKCFSADKYKADIQADLQKGQAAGVTGTPSIFLNGKLLSSGYMPYDQIKAAIDAALASGG